MAKRPLDTSKAKCRTCGGPYDQNEATYSIANKWDDTNDEVDVLLEFEHWKCHTPIEKLLGDMKGKIEEAQRLAERLRKRGF